MSSSVHTQLVPVNREHYGGKSLTRDAVDQVDPEAYAIMTQVLNLNFLDIKIFALFNFFKIILFRKLLNDTVFAVSSKIGEFSDKIS